MSRLAFVVAFSVFGATPAIGQSVSLPASPGATPPEAKPKLICEHEEKVGTRLGGHRVCKTAAEWAEERRAARDAVDRAQLQRGCGSTGC